MPLIEAHPNCDVQVEGSKEYNIDGTGVVGAVTSHSCPLIDRTDPDNPKSYCIISVLKELGFTRIAVVKGNCPQGQKSFIGDEASNN